MFGLFRRKKKKETLAFIRGSGRYAINVVGESYYQDSLERICGGKKEESANLKVTANLVCEYDNPADANAVRVDIEGLKVGYLARGMAKELRTELQEIQEQGTPIVCYAVIRGGWKRGRDEGHFGVRLDLPTEWSRYQK